MKHKIKFYRRWYLYTVWLWYDLCRDIRYGIGKLQLWFILIPKLWWNKLWIRKDEFDKSLVLDERYLDYTFDEYGQQRLLPRSQKYLKDLAHRRYITHKRDIEKKDTKRDQ